VKSSRWRGSRVLLFLVSTKAQQFREYVDQQQQEFHNCQCYETSHKRYHRQKRFSSTHPPFFFGKFSHFWNFTWIFPIRKNNLKKRKKGKRWEKEKEKEKDETKEE
jgi:hypothetical protein